MNSDNPNPSINQNYPLPHHFSSLLSPSLERTERTRILGRPLKFDLFQREGEELRNAYYYVYRDNFILGGLWGLLSGYGTKSLFKPNCSFSKRPERAPTTLVGVPYYFVRSTVISARVIQRFCLAGLLFDFVEKQAAERNNGSRSNTLTVFAALAVSAFTFRLSNRPRKNLFYTTGILGGYFLGATLPTLLFGPARERKSKD